MTSELNHHDPMHIPAISERAVLAPRSRRRRFQFTLRTLLAAVAVIGTASGYIAHEAVIVSERKAMLTEVVNLGGNWGWEKDVKADDPALIRRILGDVPSHVWFSLPATTPPGMVRRIWLTFPSGFACVHIPYGAGAYIANLKRESDGGPPIEEQMSAFEWPAGSR